ncbi:GNAT family N-acetyltransferase [Candidatus Woesebacteria bacterium]|nr:GNAT family N-acetyltransferase [Candidatus Woesebacteria bacterium]
MKIYTQDNPDHKEVRELFERAFNEILEDETGYFTPELDQNTLKAWFDYDEMIKYMKYGKLVEARDEENKLIGAGFVAKQHPISWPDGKKVELFIIGVLPGTQRGGLGSMILQKCEEAARDFGASTVMVNAHSMQPQLHTFYQKNGYKLIGELSDYYENGNAKFFTKSLS